MRPLSWQCSSAVELAVQVAERAHADEVMRGGFSPVTVAAAAVWLVLRILKQEKVLLRKVVATTAFVSEVAMVNMTRRMEGRFDRLWLTPCGYSQIRSGSVQ
ncbi:hypothetical protein BV898_04368 [Hypsibius exemplaris]|nr:hypothetical protein BV898_04368 [Hypsibius exemplaris]